MSTSKLTYEFDLNKSRHSLDLIFVHGTRSQPYLFGDPGNPIRINIPDFFISTTPLTQALWTHVMGTNPSINRGENKPLENISWLDLTSQSGFLSQLNAHILKQLPTASNLRFRLPSESEWEYAARGGPHWTDNFPYSGSNDIDSVAWYNRKWGDHTHDVAQKKPNQLGLYDMSGNVWEWCHDSHTRDIHKIPTDGTPYLGDGPDRVLRGGCFHNWAQHCTVFKRYEIAKDAHDGCIGLRLVLA